MYKKGKEIQKKYHVFEGLNSYFETQGFECGHILYEMEYAGSHKKYMLSI